MTTTFDQSLYDELTARNRGFVPRQTQQLLQTATVLVAGCGSTGGASVEPLARLGVQNFLLADNGCYELNNLNRQAAYLDEIGQNKADVCARRVGGVNPQSTAEVHRAGINSRNVDDLVDRCAVVIDGVDVTEPAGWVAKFELHAAAARLGRPVVTGYDMAGAQYVRYYDYRRPRPAFDGRITRQHIDSLTTWGLLRRAVPLWAVPVEMLESARRSVATGEESVPQVVYASLLFGAIAAKMVVDIVGGRRVRRHTLVNVDRAIHPLAVNAFDRLRKPVVLVQALADLAATERSARRT
ncbi:MAG: ThiF family adenylyltransferase [Candidatus Nanopelagicales bacterium]